MEARLVFGKQRTRCLLRNRVVRGMDVVDRLELGDRITGARMLGPGPGSR